MAPSSHSHNNRTAHGIIVVLLYSISALAQQFPAYPIPYYYPGLSVACKAALETNVVCHPLLPLTSSKWVLKILRSPGILSELNIEDFLDSMYKILLQYARLLVCRRYRVCGKRLYRAVLEAMLWRLTRWTTLVCNDNSHLFVRFWCDGNCWLSKLPTLLTFWYMPTTLCVVVKRM